MRIVFITGTSTRVRDGSGTAVGIAILRRALEARGHHVELIAPAGAVSVSGRLAFDWRARRAVRESGAEVVVAFDSDGAFLPRLRFPRVAAVKGVVADEMRFERGAARLSLGVLSFFERLHVRRADRVVTTSRYAARAIESAYGVPATDIGIVPEPIDLARWKAALAGSARRESVSPVILCVAHLYPRKDVATLFEAVEQMRTPAEVRIIGDGPERENLSRIRQRPALAQRAVIRGFVSFPELAAEYRSADIFCLPSRQEGFGIVFLEAMAAGLPVVAARAGAAPEVIVDGQTGLLVPPGDVHALAAVLDELASNPARRRALGEAGERRAALYDAPLVASAFLDAIGLPQDAAAAARDGSTTSP